MNYFTIICTHSFDDKTCSELRGSLSECIKCEQNTVPNTYYTFTSTSVGWQVCPLCNGTGIQPAPVIYNTPDICTICKGKKIISIATGLPPNN